MSIVFFRWIALDVSAAHGQEASDAHESEGSREDVC